MSIEVLKEEKLLGVRKTIARRMSESLERSPQATLTTRMNVEAILQLKARPEYAQEKITFTDFFIKAVAIALESHPLLNSSFQDGKIVQFGTINMGVAVGTDEGLFVPVIRDVQKKSVGEVSEELKQFAQKIRDGRVESDDFVDGTFTISNLGMFGVDSMTPIINPPQAAILCIGATRKEVQVEEDDTQSIQPIATLSLTIDHGVMDGIHAARFLATLGHVVTNLSSHL